MLVVDLVESSDDLSHASMCILVYIYKGMGSVNGCMEERLLARLEAALELLRVSLQCLDLTCKNMRYTCMH